MELDCIFCKIIARQFKSDIIAENDQVLVIKDIAPKATYHYLILPKKHYKGIQEASDCSVVCSLVSMARSLSGQNSATTSYRLVINNGYDVGQRVFHLHMHFLAGSKIPEF